MGNKQQLQLNNETIDSILSNVLGLPSQESLKQGAYVWKKLTAQGGDFIDFVVSDSETAYPDGGEQGGYWYEKVVEGIHGVETGTVTLSAMTDTITISHNLGVRPSMQVLWSDSETGISPRFSFYPFLGNRDAVGCVVNGSNVYTFGNSSNETTLYFPAPSVYKWAIKEYRWIAVV